MLSRIHRVLSWIVFSMSMGESVRDKLNLLQFFAKRMAVSRGLARHDGHRLSIRAKLNGCRFPVCLRDNNTDILLFEDLFGRHTYAVEGHPRCIVDAGANIGLASLYLSLAHPQASIASFEPVEHEMCKCNTSNVFALALGKSEGSISILIDPNNSGGHRLELYDTDPSLQRLQVPLRRLDMLIDEGKISAPDLLKIDAEGAECDILEGLGIHIGTLRYLVAEAQSKKNHEWIITHLRSNGFTQFDERILHPEAHLPGDAYSIIVARR